MGRQKINYLLENYVEDVIYSWIDRLGIYVRIDEYQYSVIRASYGTFVSNSADWSHTLENFSYLNETLKVSDIKYTSDFVHIREHNYVNAYITTDEFTIHAFQFLWSSSFIRFSLYWKFFRLCQVLSIHDPIQFFKDLVFQHMSIWDRQFSIFVEYPVDLWQFYRVDYCIDVRNVTVENYYTKLGIYVKKEFKSFWKKQKIRLGEDWMETVYIGTRGSKYAYASVYNKLLDTMSKWHFSLYKDYFENFDVTRIEFRFFDEFFNKSMNFSDFSFLQNKIKSYMWLENTRKLPFWSWFRYKKDVIIDKCRYAAKLTNMLIKWSNNWLDFRAIFRQVNKEQHNNYFRVRRTPKK